MILKQIEMCLNQPDFPSEICNPFNYQVRSFGNFLERSVKEQKLKMEYGRYFLTLVGERLHVPSIDDGTLQICIPFDLEGYKKLPLQQLNDYLNRGLIAKTPKAIREFDETRFPKHEYTQLPIAQISEFFIEHFIKGMKAVEGVFEIPSSLFLEAIEKFRKAQYKNKWVLKAKTFKKERIKVVLENELLISDFLLNLKILCDDEIVFSEVLLRRPPSEYIFQHLLKGPLIKKVSPQILFIDISGHTYRKDISEYLN
ncbi:MAG: hypothetical protein ACRBBN_04765 [Methyloligellaceae bacterium]